MLVILSDIHLTDGSSAATVSSGAFDIFARRLREGAEAASWRADGYYRPIDRIDLVLLGDILDVIGSMRWSSQSQVRPWHDPHSPEFVDQVGRITNDILQHNQQALAIVRGLAGEGGVAVPPPLRTGRPAPEAEGAPIPVKIHYLVGNRDWVYQIPGPKYDLVRQKVTEWMGLANRGDAAFPHDFTESEELLQTMRRHKVAARHGDLFDPFSFEGDRCTSSLSDAIVVELVNRFAFEVETRWANELPAGTVVGLREIDNVRPLLLIPVWIDGLLERTCPMPAVRKQVKEVWDRLVDEFLAIDFVCRQEGCGPADLVDGLRRALRFSKRLSAGWASAVADWSNRLRGAPDGSYSHHALGEPDFRNRRARQVVYGHTHLAESVPLDASYAEGYVLNQMYFNAGTWRRVHRQTQLAPAEHEFIASDVMTYLVFFQGDERKGRPYETWSGTLGFNPSEVTIHRIDPGRPSHATGQPVSPPSLHSHAPHFPAPSHQPGVVPGRRV